MAARTSQARRAPIPCHDNQSRPYPSGPVAARLAQARIRPSAACQPGVAHMAPEHLQPTPRRLAGPVVRMVACVIESQFEEANSKLAIIALLRSEHTLLIVDSTSHRLIYGGRASSVLSHRFVDTMWGNA